jgi:hypothetical protein
MRIQAITTAILLASALLVPGASAQNAGPGGQANPPVTGLIQSFDGKTLSIKTADGNIVAAGLAPNARIIVSVKKTLADIKPGDFIASGGTRGPDGKIHANEIRIFSAPGGEGQFPMSAPGQVMTNATVKQVMTDATVKQVANAGGGAPTIKLSFHGAGAPGAANCTGRSADAPGGAGKGCIGETEFDVPANVPVVAQLPGDVSALKPGAKASMSVAKGADGSSSATRVTISQ